MKIIRSEFFQLNIVQNIQASQFYFPDAANLRNVHLLGMRVYSVNDLTKTPDGLIPVTPAIIGNTFLVLQDYTGKIILNQFPIIELNNTSTNIGAGVPSNAYNSCIFTGQKINWPKSYIMFDKANFVLAPASYYFAIMYAENIKIEKDARKTGFQQRK